MDKKMTGEDYPTADIVQRAVKAITYCKKCRIKKWECDCVKFIEELREKGILPEKIWFDIKDPRCLKKK